MFARRLPAVLALLLALLAGLPGPVRAASGRFRLDGAAYPKRAVDEASLFFASGTVPFLSIEIAPDQYSALQKNNRVYVRATIREDTAVYADVGIHAKGSAGSVRALDQKPALTLNFDKFTSNQKFHGLDKIHLNNSVQDGSYLSELICAELFNAADVPAPRVTHAFARLNGREQGLFVLKEGFDTVFLKLHFTNWMGALYDGGFLQDIDVEKKLVSNVTVTNRSIFTNLVAACREPDHALRRKKMEQFINLDQFSRFLAMEMITCHWDGYAQNKNNYRIYHDPTTDRLVFLPGGMDQMFADPNFPLIPGNGMVATALVRGPEDRQKYLQLVKHLFETVYDIKKLTNRVDEVVARVKPWLQTVNTNDAKVFQEQANNLKQRLIARAQGIQKQFQAPVKTLPFENGIAKLPDFYIKNDSGNPTLEKSNEGGRPQLRIRATADGSVASWRTKVLLGQGKYSFQGRARVFSVPVSTDPANGAALRISGGQRRTSITGSSPEWLKLEYDIEINDASAEVELVCELRCNKGAQAWFDASTLRLVRK